jgi:type VI secretion system protein ImpK
MASDKDNPFGDPGDSERTVIRPRPGVGRGAPAAPPPQPAQPMQSPPPRAAGTAAPPFAAATGSLPIELPGPGINPVVDAAATLLALATRLRRARQPQNIGGLRERVIAELKVFEQKIRAQSLPTNLIRAAHYAVCVTIDDIVLNSPWGSQSLWTQQSLLSTFHTDVAGGDRFFDVLGSLQSDPAKNISVLELFFVCLSLGFEGRYRVHPRGASELARIQENLYHVVHQFRGETERELSPHWQGIPAPHRSIASLVPTWVVAVVALVALLIVYMGLSFALSDSSDPVFEELAKLPPLPGVTTAVAAPTPPPAPVKSAFLAQEVAAGLCTVQETPQAYTVTLRATGMFASGSATVEPRYVDALQRIGAEIEKEPGQVQVIGHSDNVPIRTIQFPSNFALSEARAKAAAGLIASRLTSPDRVTAQGRGDTEPVDSNATPAGREANRRIEVILIKAPKA